MPLSAADKLKTTTDDLELIKQFPDRFRLKAKEWRRGRPKGKVNKVNAEQKQSVSSIPLKKEWEEISRLVLTNIKELLLDRDDDGKLTCTPALLTAASKLVVESSTVYKEPKKEDANVLQKQLTAKRKKRKLKITEPEVIPLKKSTEINNFGDLGYVAESEQTNPSVFHKEQAQDIK